MEETIKKIINEVVTFLTEAPADIKINKKSDEEIHIDISVKDAAQLIGRGGQTIAAIRLVASLLIRQALDFNGRLYLDINNYYKNKDEELLNKIRQIVDEVISQGVARQVFYLNPRQRRLVHVFCDGVDGVVTRSEDSNRGRVLIIEPSGQNNNV